MNITTPLNSTFSTSSHTVQATPTPQATPRSTHQGINQANHQQRSGLKQNKTFRNFMYFATAVSSLFYLGLNIYIVGQVGKIRKSLEVMNKQNKQVAPPTQTATPKAT
jgi:hypothetical protein